MRLARLFFLFYNLCMNHACSTLIVHCLDFRLQRAIKKYLEEQKLLGDCDVVAIAGAVKNLEFVLDQVDISKRLHNIKKIILMNHTDCGAYGGSPAFGSLEQEIRHHEAELTTAREAILAIYPELEIQTLLAKIRPDHSVSLVD